MSICRRQLRQVRFTRELRVILVRMPRHEVLCSWPVKLSMPLWSASRGISAANDFFLQPCVHLCGECGSEGRSSQETYDGDLCAEVQVVHASASSGWLPDDTGRGESRACALPVVDPRKPARLNLMDALRANGIFVALPAAGLLSELPHNVRGDMCPTARLFPRWRVNMDCYAPDSRA